MSEHILITVLNNNPREAKYSLNEKTFNSTISTIALVELLPEDEKPDTVIAVCTEEAKNETYNTLKAALKGKCKVSSIEYKNERNEECNDEFLIEFTEKIPSRGDIVLSLDLTHGFRSLPILIYFSAQLLNSLRDIEIRNLYYAAWEPNVEITPIISMKRILELQSWAHAVEMFRKARDMRELIELIQTEDSVISSKKSEVKDNLENILFAYQSGLPVELGLASSKFIIDSQNELKDDLKDKHKLPLSEEIVNKLREGPESFKLKKNSKTTDLYKKTDVQFDKEELIRQAKIIEDVKNHGDYAVATGMLLEWLESYVLLQIGECKWLTSDARKKAGRKAQQIGGIYSSKKEKVFSLTTEQERFGSLYNDVKEVRNLFHHHGMRSTLWSVTEPVRSAQGDRTINIEEIFEYWKEHFFDCPSMSFELEKKTSSGNLLISPQGNSPGVFYSAINAVRDRLGKDADSYIAICSKESEKYVRESIEKAGFKGKEVGIIKLCDAFEATNKEIKQYIESIKIPIKASDKTFINITGGTSLMGLIMAKIYTYASTMYEDTERFGLIDRRIIEEQRSDPYCKSQAFWIDDKE